MHACMHEYYFTEVMDDSSLSETFAAWAGEIESTGILCIKLLNAVMNQMLSYWSFDSCI